MVASLVARRDHPPGMTELDDARQLMASHFPHVPLAWFGCDEQGERRVDAFLAGDAGEACPFYVMSLRIDGRFVADAVSEYPHLSYKAMLLNAKPPRSEATGVFVTTWPVHAADASQVRFTHRGAIRTTPVRAGPFDPATAAFMPADPNVNDLLNQAWQSS